MIVPQYWAEGRCRHRGGDRQVTVRRFGWSDTSADDAQAMADRRAEDALQRVLAGEKLERRDPRVPYNGADGVPIREEIVARHGPTVITRNSYGARCLNTPEVLFVDVDFREKASWSWTLAVFAMLAAMVLAIGWFRTGLGWSTAMMLVFALLLSDLIAGSLYRVSQQIVGGREAMARRRIDRFLGRSPGWGLRLYRTPAGLRVMMTHALFDPVSPTVAECFRALGTDPVYVAMCRRQRCFRARLTAKPWRIGIGTHLRPRPGVWPVAAERMAQRRAWIDDYERIAAGYAACAFVAQLGNASVHPQVKEVQDLHDELCGAHARRPLA